MQCMFAELYAVMRDLGREAEEVRNMNEGPSMVDTETGMGTEDTDQTKTELRLAESKARLASLQDRLSMMAKDDAQAEVEKPVEVIDEESMEEDEDEDSKQCKGLFKNLKFFLGREVFFVFHQCL